MIVYCIYYALQGNSGVINIKTVTLAIYDLTAKKTGLERQIWI